MCVSTPRFLFVTSAIVLLLCGAQLKAAGNVTETGNVDLVFSPLTGNVWIDTQDASITSYVLGDDQEGLLWLNHTPIWGSGFPFESPALIGDGGSSASGVFSIGQVLPTGLMNADLVTDFLEYACYSDQISDPMMLAVLGGSEFDVKTVPLVIFDERASASAHAEVWDSSFGPEYDGFDSQQINTFGSVGAGVGDYSSGYADYTADGHADVSSWRHDAGFSGSVSADAFVVSEGPMFHPELLDSMADASHTVTFEVTVPTTLELSGMSEVILDGGDSWGYSELRLVNNNDWVVVFEDLIEGTGGSTQWSGEAIRLQPGDYELNVNVMAAASHYDATGFAGSGGAYLDYTFLAADAMPLADAGSQYDAYVDSPQPLPSSDTTVAALTIAGGGELDVAAAETLTVDEGITVQSGGSLHNVDGTINADLQVDTGAAVTSIGGTITGDTAIDPGATFSASESVFGDVVTFGGLTVTGGPSSGETVMAGLTVIGGGTVNVGPSATVTVGEPIVVAQGGSLDNSEGTINADLQIQYGAAATSSDGTINGNVTIDQGATLSASGAIYGDVVNAGVLSIGGGTYSGTLANSGTVSFTGGGTFTGGATNTGTADFITGPTGGGSITFGGGGYTNAGTTTLSGVPGFQWSVVEGDTVLRLHYVPEPATMAMLALGALAVARRRRR